MIRQARSWLLSMLLLVCAAQMAHAHEGHDHDKPPPLNLPVAPRVVAVTPDFELVGVVSGIDRLTIFLHAFDSNEPVTGATMTVSAGSNSAAAQPQDDGVFTLTAPWLANSDTTDLVFDLKLADGSQDLLTGRLQRIAALGTGPSTAVPDASVMAWLQKHQDFLAVGLGGAAAGTLITLLLAGSISRRRKQSEHATAAQASSSSGVAGARNTESEPVTPIRRSAGAIILMALSTAMLSMAGDGIAAEAANPELPSVPATLATDLAQRMPDGTLFVPKATQHLLSVRTMLAASAEAPSTVELTGTIVAGPEHFGRVQPGRPGRIDAAPGGLAYIGKRVEKGELLAYVQTYIEAADRANIDSLIAETEGRIEKNRTILSRYEKKPGVVPQVKVDEVRGELDALKRRRAELLPSVASREPIFAPISGIVSVANATIGQIVESRDVLFEIVDPSQFWVEAHGHGHQSKAIENLRAAYAIVGDGRKIKLEFAGRGLALRHQATVMTFKMAGFQGDLSIGMPVEVLLQSSANLKGHVIPASAVVRGQTGLPIVWVKTEPERFEPQNVKTMPLDGDSVIVSAGIKDDMRIVTEGVTLLNQVR